jgi:UDP-glucose 4-epimerase
MNWGIKNLVFTSSVAVYGLNKINPNEESSLDPFNHYGKSKWEAEQVIKEWYEKDPQGKVCNNHSTNSDFWRKK